ncbi:MAG: hypothetical protein EBS73_00350 [Betaproteobacteria bacterium]|nr:hypothetical protein [Betaproteobacteria bacterium]
MQTSAPLKQLLKLAGPVLVSQLAVMANGVIDTVMAGQLSSTELAGLGLGTSIYIIAYVSLLSVLLGLSPIVAQHVGAGRIDAIGLAFRQSLLLALILGVIGTLVLSQTRFWSQLSGAPLDVAQKVEAYLFWCALGVIPALIVRAFSALCTAVSRPRLVMWVNLASLCFKVPLNAVLMYGWGDFGIDAMGAAGAACSSCILALASAIAVLGLATILRTASPRFAHRRHCLYRCERFCIDCLADRTLWRCGLCQPANRIKPDRRRLYVFALARKCHDGPHRATFGR